MKDTANKTEKTIHDTAWIMRRAHAIAKKMKMRINTYSTTGTISYRKAFKRAVKAAWAEYNQAIKIIEIDENETGNNICELDFAMTY